MNKLIALAVAAAFASAAQAQDKPKPIRDSRVVGRQIWRVPDSGYVTPRLREGTTKDAIGFVHYFEPNDYDEPYAKAKR